MSASSPSLDDPLSVPSESESSSATATLLPKAQPNRPYKQLWLAVTTAAVLLVAGAIVMFTVPSLSSGVISLFSPSSSRPLGQNFTISNITVYKTGTGPDVIMLLTDINGMGEDATQLCDRYAANDFTVFMPDLFDGNLANRNMTRSIIIAQTVTQYFIQTGYYRSFQGQGYCWGGKVAISLNQMNLTRSSVSAHGASLNSTLDAPLIIWPVSFVQPETDPGFNNQAADFDRILTARNIPHQFKIYPGTTHGFAVASNRSPQSQLMKEDALLDSISWFKKHT